MCKKKPRSKEVARTYHDAAYEIAKMIGNLKYLNGRFECLSEQMGDNMDPFIDSQEAIEKLGIALASTVVYEHEYESEAKDVETGNVGSDK